MKYINRLLNVSSVYDIDEYSISGLVYRLLDKVNEIVTSNNDFKDEIESEMQNWIDYIKLNVSEELLIAHINDKLEQWYKADKFQIAINDSLVSEMSTYSSQKLEEKFDEVETQCLILDERTKQLGVAVEMFGAKGDGVTDDTEAIQSTFDFASQHGVDVIFSNQKTYCVSRTLTLKPVLQTTSVEGSDIHFTNNTIVNLKATNGATIKVTERVENVIEIVCNNDIQTLGSWNFTIDKLTIDGNHLAKRAIYLNYIFHSLITKCRISNCEFGIVSDTCSDTTIRDCVVKAKYCLHIPTGGDGLIESCDLYPTVGGRGVWLGGFAGNYIVNGNTISGDLDGGFNVGVWLDGTMTFNETNGLLAMVTIANNEFSSLARAIKTVGKSATEKTIYDIQIINNHMTNAFTSITDISFADLYACYNVFIQQNTINTHASNRLQYGIKATDCETLKIVDNKFMNLMRNAIDFNNVSNSIIRSNEFWNTGIEHLDFCVINLRNTNTFNNEIELNSFRNDLSTYSLYAVREIDGADSNHATRNKFINVKGYATPNVKSIFRRIETVLNAPATAEGYHQGDIVYLKNPTTTTWGYILINSSWIALSTVGLLGEV